MAQLLGWASTSCACHAWAGISRAVSCLDRAGPWASRRASGLMGAWGSVVPRPRGISRHFPLLDAGSPARDATRKAKPRNARKKGGLCTSGQCAADSSTLARFIKGKEASPPAPDAPYIFQLLLSLSLFRPNQL